MAIRSLLAATAAAFLAGSVDGQTLVDRFNCGWIGVTTSTGETFATDQPYVAGVTNGFVGGVPAFEVLSQNGGILIGGDDHPWDELVTYGRLDWSAYRFDVPNGDYIVRLVVAETHNQGPGLRQMTVDAEGVPLAASLDLAATFGVQYVGVLAAEVTVSDGTLDVVAQPGPGINPSEVEAPLIHAIEVWNAPVTYPGPSGISGFEVQASYEANLLAWDWNTSDPTVAAYLIERANAAGGPFATVATIAPAPSRYIDRSAQPGQEHFYRVAAIDFVGQTGPPGPVLSATAMASHDSALRVYELELNPANQLFLDENILLQPGVEVPAVWTFDSVSENVETRYRGGAARQVSKKSWKVKFPATGLFEGRADLNLKASFVDTSLSREALAFELHRQMGVPAPSVRPIQLRVGDNSLGLFNEVEQVDEIFLAARNRDTGASIYKCFGTLTTLPSPAEYETTYEKKTNTSSDHSDLIELIEFLNAAPSPNFVLELADRVDLDGYLDYLAVIGWTSDQDTKAQNYYLIHDHALERWEVIPWDPDSSFGLVPGTETKSIMAGTTLDPGGGGINQLRERVLTDDGLRWRFTQKLEELDALFADASVLGPKIDAAHAERFVDALADPFKFGWERAQRFVASLAELHGFVATRSALVQAEIPVFQPLAAPTEVWINEISASAQTTLADGAGDFDDWVEIYNDGASPADLSGAFLTDDLGQPTLWSLPAGTIIPAGGHLVVWCDDEPLEGPLHATFRLSSAGEELGLIAADGTTLIDFASWGPQAKDVTHGRRSDGGALFTGLPTATPGAANTTAGNTPPFVSWVQHSPTAPSPGQSVEVTCLAIDADGLTSVELTWRVGGGSFTTFPMAPIGADRYAATVPGQLGGAAVNYYVSATDLFGASTSLPIEAPVEFFTYFVIPPGTGPLRINEILASNNSHGQDETGTFEDWIELANDGATTLDVGGMFLSDSLADPDKWALPPGTTIPPNGTLLVWADDEPADGPLHASFKLSAGGEEIGLFDAGQLLVDGFSFGPQDTDVALGRLTAFGERYRLFQPTPDASNFPSNGATLGYGAEEPAVNPLVLAAPFGPFIGSPWSLTAAGGAPSAVGVLFVGLDALSIPIDPTSTLLVLPFAPATLVFATGPFGAGTPVLPVPADANLSGLSIYAQAWVDGTGLSNGILATIGP